MKLLKLVLREVQSTLLWVLMLPFKGVTRPVQKKEPNYSSLEEMVDPMNSVDPMNPLYSRGFLDK